eukprot:TRINITY_DN2269_c0_g1_i17.p1 TRINITY_DN2269_c0_g1~~TRINITY_DN2269_c0_g1_i17.p1  ORF type:complete len:887 (-),score=251.96 TRINITY_DN2269_c0_g1_i17:135-2795(-)
MATGLFGTTGASFEKQTSPEPAAPLFAANLFGAAKEGAPAPVFGSLFSAKEAAPAGEAAPSGGLFGGSAAPAGGMFGAKEGAPSGGLFGGGSTEAVPAGGMFGAKEAAPSSGGLFGGGGAKEAAPAGGMFGAKEAAPSSGGLFGGSAKEAAPAGGMFGAKEAAPSSGGVFSAGSTEAVPAGGMFGAKEAAPSSGGLFGGGAKEAAPAGGMLKEAAPSAGLFGGAAEAESAPAPASAGSLFSATEAAPAAGMFSAKEAAPSAPPSGSLFSGGAKETAPAGGLFGGAAAAEAAPAGSIFSVTKEAPAPAPAPAVPEQRSAPRGHSGAQMRALESALSDQYPTELAGCCATQHANARYPSVQWCASRSFSSEATEIIAWDPVNQALNCLNVNAEGHVHSTVHSVRGLDFQPQEWMLSHPLVCCYDDTSCAVLKLPVSGESSEESLEARLVLRCAAGTSIIQASFHPLSSEHLCVLCDDGTLCVYKFDFLQRATQSTFSPEQTVQVPYTTVSFCFAEDSGWGAVGLYLVSSEGSVHSVCPVLPYHTPLAVGVLEQLLEGVAVLPVEAQHSARLWLEDVQLLSTDGQSLLQDTADPSSQLAVIRKPHNIDSRLSVCLQQVFHGSHVDQLHSDSSMAAASDVVCLSTSSSPHEQLTVLLVTHQLGVAVLLIPNRMSPALEQAPVQAGVVSTAASDRQAQLMEQVQLCSHGSTLCHGLVKDPFRVDRVFVLAARQLVSLSVPGVRRGKHMDEWPVSEGGLVASVPRDKHCVGRAPLHLSLLGQGMAMLLADESDGRLCWRVDQVHEAGENETEPSDEWFYHHKVDEWEAKALVARKLRLQVMHEKQHRGDGALMELKETIIAVKRDLVNATAADYFERLDPALTAVDLSLIHI